MRLSGTGWGRRRHLSIPILCLLEGYICLIAAACLHMGGLSLYPGDDDLVTLRARRRVLSMAVGISGVALRLASGAAPRRTAPHSPAITVDYNALDGAVPLAHLSHSISST